MSTDGDRPSVRVEVDGAVVTSDAPAFDSSSEGSEKWALGVALAALVGVALVLVLLQASPSEAPVDDSTAESERVITPIDLSAARVTALSIATETEISTIRGTEAGFVALVAGPSGVTPFLETPPLLTSSDGIDWVARNTSIEGIRSDARASWFRLTETPTELSITGRIAVVGREDSPRTFVSNDGIDWVVTDVDRNVPGNPRLSTLVSQGDDAWIYREVVGNLEIAHVVSQHTNIDLVGTPICGAQMMPSDERQVMALGACADNPVIVTEAEVLSSSDTVDVFACLELLGDQPAVSTRAVRVDPETGQSARFRESISPSALFDSGFERSNGTFAVIDVGGTPDERAELAGADGGADPDACDGVADFDGTDHAGVLILEPASLGVTRFAPPATSEISWFTFTPEILGEVMMSDGSGSPWLIIAIGPELWAVDGDSGSWVELVDVTAERSDAQVPDFAVSSSGNRVYWVDDVLAVIDVALDSSGAISVVATSLPIDGPTEALRSGRILYATDAVVFYSQSFSNDEIWRIGAMGTAIE